MADPSSSEFFEQVRDGLVTALDGRFADVGGYAHGFGLKLTFGDGERTKEHYEAQLVRGRRDGAIELEIGFHSEYPKAQRNDEVLRRLVAHERKWRKILGNDPVVGPFLGNDRWRRISETWEQYDFRDLELPFEVTDRLVQYVEVFEPLLERN